MQYSYLKWHILGCPQFVLWVHSQFRGGPRQAQVPFLCQESALSRNQIQKVLFPGLLHLRDCSNVAKLHVCIGARSWEKSTEDGSAHHLTSSDKEWLSQWKKAVTLFPLKLCSCDDRNDVLVGLKGYLLRKLSSSKKIFI